MITCKFKNYWIWQPLHDVVVDMNVGYEANDPGCKVFQLMFFILFYSTHKLGISCSSLIPLLCQGAHSFSDKKLCPAWGAVCRKCKIKNHYQDSKECKRLERERQGKRSDPEHSKSFEKPFVLKVEEEDGDHYEVLDKICVLNQNGDQKKAFANLLLSKKQIPVKFQIDSSRECIQGYKWR